MLEPGKSYTQHLTVASKDTALAYGSGHLEVFATPALVTLMENTAVKCLEGVLETGSDTVGIKIDVQHTKATKIGGEVSCTAIITEIDGRRIRFEIDASDEKGPIGHAVHDRFMIDPERFMSKL